MVVDILTYLTELVLAVYFIFLVLYTIWWEKNLSLHRTDITYVTTSLKEVESGLVVAEEEMEPFTPITVIIPARNEEKNIAACLQSLAEQTYPSALLQIIVVNDHSSDRTEQIVRNFPAPNIILINLADHITAPINSYKKKAIEVAIRMATGELIVTTDADCTAPPRWLEKMSHAYSQENMVFIAGPVRLVPAPGKKKKSLLYIFQALDFLALQWVTGGAVYKRFHAMCNGANLAYEKAVFYEVNGFSGIDEIASGDDMLLMHKILRKYPDRVTYLSNKNAIVDTQAAGTWSAFFHQRIRWASKAGKYNDKKITMVLLLVYVANVLLLLQLLGGILYPEHLYVFLLALGFKTLYEMVSLLLPAYFFGMKRLLIWFPLMQPLHIIYIVVAGFLGKFGKYSWKGRKVK